MKTTTITANAIRKLIEASGNAASSNITIARAYRALLAADAAKGEKTCKTS